MYSILLIILKYDPYDSRNAVRHRHQRMHSVKISKFLLSRKENLLQANRSLEQGGIDTTIFSTELLIFMARTLTFRLSEP